MKKWQWPYDSSKNFLFKKTSIIKKKMLAAFLVKVIKACVKHEETKFQTVNVCSRLTSSFHFSIFFWRGSSRVCSTREEEWNVVIIFIDVPYATALYTVYSALDSQLNVALFYEAKVLCWNANGRNWPIYIVELKKYKYYQHISKPAQSLLNEHCYWWHSGDKIWCLVRTTGSVRVVQTISDQKAVFGMF